MKNRLIAFSLLITVIITSLLSLSACGSKYEPVESSSEEKRTVMTISYEGEKYEVAYELYRAFFLQLKSSVDGGDESVWTAENKNKYIEEIDKLICLRICEIYAVFHLCEMADINPFSNKFDDKIEEYIEIAVEGGVINGEVYKGFEGDYNAYLNSLKEMNLNYSVQALLLRYQLALEELAIHYMGNITDGDLTDGAELGEIKYTKEDVESFYFDPESSRRVFLAYLDERYFTAERAQQIRDTIASKPDELSVKNYIAGFTLGTPTSEIVGRYTYDKFYYSEFTDCAFSLDVGETGPVITLKTDEFDGYIIVYRTQATEEYFNSNYANVVNSYLYSEFGEVVESASSGLMRGISFESILRDMDRSKISIQ
jgi:hypothetical protein